MLAIILTCLGLALIASPSVVASREIDIAEPGATVEWIARLDPRQKRELDGAVWLGLLALILAVLI